MEETEKVIDSQKMKEDAQKILIEEKLEREKKCQIEISASLEKYKCRLEAVIVLRENRVIPKIELIGQ